MFLVNTSVKKKTIPRIQHNYLSRFFLHEQKGHAATDYIYILENKSKEFTKYIKKHENARKKK